MDHKEEPDCELYHRIAPLVNKHLKEAYDAAERLREAAEARRDLRVQRRPAEFQVEPDESEEGFEED